MDHKQIFENVLLNEKTDDLSVIEKQLKKFNFSGQTKLIGGRLLISLGGVDLILMENGKWLLED